MLLNCYNSQEGEVLDPYGEWVPVEKTSDKDGADTRKFHASVAMVSTSSSTSETIAPPGTEVVEVKPVGVPDTDSVFPDPLLQVGSVPCFSVVLLAQR